MGSGTHCSKTDGFPGTHGTHGTYADGATGTGGRVSSGFRLLPVVLREAIHSTLWKIQMKQNCKTPSQIFDIWCKNVRQRCGSFKKNSSIMSFLVNPG